VDSQNQLESHHGVLMNVGGSGILIIGPPAIGKSSLALALLSQGHQLIADDIVDFSCSKNTITGHCPPMLCGLLHTRELGLISVPTIFGKTSSQNKYPLDYVIELTKKLDLETTFTPKLKKYTVLNQSFPLLSLNVSNPASLSIRIDCWLKSQAHQSRTEDILKQGQHKLMESVK